MSLRPAIGFKKIPCESNFYSNNGSQKPVIKCTYARWNGKPMRNPRKDELFISGAIPVAYVAKADMSTEYYIAIPA